MREPLTPDPPPLRRGVPLLRQQWLDVAFLHWAVAPERVQPLLPPGVYPDTIDGVTFAGLVAFRMVDAGLARGPALPPFLEVNVRVYSVDERGRRGVVFLSMDVDDLAMAAGGRLGLSLPYRLARLAHRRDRDRHDYSVAPRRDGGPSLALRVAVRGSLEPGPLEVFLTSRWALHTWHLRRTRYVRNTHEPWPLRHAAVEQLDDRLVTAAGLPGVTDQPPDHVAFSPGVHARFGF